MRKTILFIHGGRVVNETPSQRLKLRLEWAIDYYRKHQASQDISFFVSGRWGRVTDSFLKTEAEVGKEYIIKELPEVKVIKEDISVELLGNYAFSKPLLQKLKPDEVIFITSENLQNRAQYAAELIIADAFTYSFHFLHDEFSNSPTLADKETKALLLCKKLFKNIPKGDDTACRNVLLYKTPYYFKNIIDDEAFFDEYWQGGFASYLQGINVRNNT